MTDNTEIHYTPQAVAKEIKVSVQSVRRWADAYQVLLSDAAHPAPGKTRLYTWQDIEIMKQIKDLRGKGLTPDIITIKLSEATKSQPKDTIATGSPDTSTDTAPTALQNTPAAQDSAQSTLMVLDAIDTLQHRIEALEQSMPVPVAKQGEWFSGFGFGFVAALLFVLLLLALFALRNYL